jgi:hypothetical protein
VVQSKSASPISSAVLRFIVFTPSQLPELSWAAVAVGS